LRRNAKRRSPRRAKPIRTSCRHRHIVPGATWHITQKTNDDLFWLVPSPLVNAILLYLLALKAKRYGVLVHAYFFASNHIHLVATDPEGKLPAFMRELLGESGKAIKLARRTTCDIWRDERYAATRHLDIDALERSIPYLELNSMEAELTEPEEWPGLTSARHRFGETITVARPEIYFSEKRPETVDLVRSPLSCASPELWGESAEGSEADRSSPEEIRKAAERDAASEARMREMVEKRSAEIRASLAERKQRLAGPERVMRTPCTKRTTHPIRNLNPRFSTRNHELLAHAIAEYRQFEIDHEAAKRRYLAGQQRTHFPVGTYGYRVMLGVRVARRRRRAA